VKKFFNLDTWKVTGASLLGCVSSGYAAAREAAEVPAVKLSTGYDVAVARVFALTLAVYMLSKLFLLWRNRNKQEEP
jgi:hypothetical protein